MSPTLRPDAPLSTETLAQLADADAREQFEFFREHVEEPLLDAWLLSQLSPVDSKPQALLRLARQANGYWEGFDGRQHLLFGVPMTVYEAPADRSWDLLRHELQAGLSAAFLPITTDVNVCSQPLAVQTLHSVGATQLGKWNEDFFHARDPAIGMYEPGTTGACVWVGHVSVLLQQRRDIEALLFTMNANWSKRVGALNMRLEALAEAQGIRFKMFPATAIWNSLSFARLVNARLKLDAFRKQPGPWRAVREGEAVVLQRADGAPVLSLDFPEELNSDVAPLFKGWADAQF